MIAGEEDPPVFAVGALPIVEAAAGDDLQVCFRNVGPQLTACGRVHRHDRVTLRQHVKRRVDDQRIERIAVAITGFIGPGDGELADGFAVDLG